MLDAGEIVIAVGGGGIPVVREKNGNLRGVEAVIDKDYASACLAIDINADILLILTAVEKVFRDFSLPSQKALDHLTVAEAKELLAEGQFGTGSMEPKIRAAIEFLQEIDKSVPSGLPRREREVIITLPEIAMAAMQGKTGTRIVR
jgi:carbamate kinase